MIPCYNQREHDLDVRLAKRLCRPAEESERANRSPLYAANDEWQAGKRGSVRPDASTHSAYTKSAYTQTTPTQRKYDSHQDAYRAAGTARSGYAQKAAVFRGL